MLSLRFARLDEGYPTKLEGTTPRGFRCKKNIMDLGPKIHKMVFKHEFLNSDILGPSGNFSLNNWGFSLQCWWDLKLAPGLCRMVEKS